ncbi:MAG: DNA alkylation repair protein [Nitrospinota bacterium]
MQVDEVLARLRSLKNQRNVAGMAKYGINPATAYGISIPNLRKISKEAGKDHALAAQLWKSGIHEARILASMVDEPDKVTEAQAERWARQFDSWDVCDQCCNNLFRKTRFAYKKCVLWSRAKQEFAKRAGFTLMATLAVGDKEAEDERFLRFLPLIRREAADGRNYVKKAVNWALRQIGKRNRRLNMEAVKAAKAIAKMDSKSANWIASDALRELTSNTVIKRLKN